MSQINNCFQAYCSIRKEEEPTKYLERLEMVLGRSDYMQIETAISDELTKTESEFFRAGFECAVAILRGVAV